jgi:UPF0755 protein
MKTWIKRLFLLLVLTAMTLAGGLAWYGNQPLPLASARVPGSAKTVNITPGMHLRSLAMMLHREGVIDHPLVFRLLGRMLGKGGALKVGVYTLNPPLTPLKLFDIF